MLTADLRLSLADESADALDERRRRLDVGEVAGSGDRLEARARDGRAERVAVVRRGAAPIVRAPQEQGRQLDPVQPLAELRVVEVRLPRVERRRLAIARDHCEL